MTYYDEIYDHAVDNHYLISTNEARALGIPAVELAKLAKRGKLENIGRGLYRLSRYVPSGSDPYAISVALVGDGAYLYGESVIAMLGLAPTNPDRMWVASPGRVRLAHLPEGLRIVRGDVGYPLTHYDGVPSQRVCDAIRACKGTMMFERIAQAAGAALEQGYVTPHEYETIARAEDGRL